jgi:ATP-binding cassette subfamily C protein LapB
VEQHTVLFFGTLRENITLGAPHAEDNQILNAADVGMLSDLVNRHPRGFDMMVGERGEFLSGGQRQCVAIARAALMSPSILLFDEPTSAMDFSTESLFIKKMETYSEDKTMVIVTHRMSLLSLAKRVIVMDQGRIVADGPKEAVLEALNSGKLSVAS